ncbi:hypothetical protein A2875_03535 [Candidatus Gottesmanbacteria bacterium RIFCSPHIGHO2_01_FULL_46_14]|uniref:Uncharacterized protein n=2 Tax=Candidatus Gottesmaniibacteriota TaxID=1752720 RepID=A0A1F5ZPQ3_9BACT|nr:MAG: hypothetical protein A2875_03535 [Candidatus Gottesmanbacteria bacterium RIFCSPHIGHO2_01_FULL_46_14]OGG28827.1 MAG: hypothetical protein A2971_02730 [Candidatus Gottesmanbacteria bacterium RIFCSPLOWO2_01_FULL_46_21]
MKNKKLFIVIGLGVLLGLTGFLVWRTLSTQPQQPTVEKEVVQEDLEPIDPAIKVDVKESKANTILISVSGMGGKVESVSYEVTYESGGIVQGVNSGSKPIVTALQDAFEREVYLGTCSRNVCRPHPGVKSVTVVLEFHNASGKKSQFSKEYQL